MFKYIVLAVLIGVATSAPAEDLKSHQADAAASHAAPAPAPAPAHESSAPIPQAPEAVQHEINDQPAAPAGAAPIQIAPIQHAAEPAPPAPVPTPKQLFIADLPLVKTPASTAKLTPVAATSFVAPLAYAAAPQVLASYPYPGLAALPASYSIEQHGYHIVY